ncbi:MAG: sporulation protein YqfD [Clostridiales bacterium]|nr:sporulation protein YqfD [Clostridiales bacterium]
MFLIRLFRYIFGYIIFEGKAGFPERFINLCSQTGVNIWDVKCVSGSLTAKTDIKSYKKIRPCVRKSGMKVKIKKKCGVPFLIKPYLQRKGIFAGAALSVIFLSLLLSTVWSIEVTGNEKFTDEQIISIAEEYGIYPGAFRNSIDIQYVKAQIKANVDGISWFSVNIDGGKVSLEVSETEGDNTIYDKDTPCNLISGVDGEVLKIEAYVGEPAVKPGDAVVKGDLLISGVKEKADGTPYFVHAMGTAVIRTYRTIEYSVPLTIKAMKIEKTKNYPSLYIFGLTTPAPSIDEYGIKRAERKMLSFRGTSLPIGIVSHKYSFISECSVTLSLQQAGLLCSYLLFCEEKEIMKNSEFESKIVQIVKNETSVDISFSLVNHENTAIEQYFQVE